MPCCKVTAKKNLCKCNMTSNTFNCICIPTDGKETIYVCVDTEDNIVRCDENKCGNSSEGTSKCIALETGGATSICVSKTEAGITKCDDCSCVFDDRSCKNVKCDEPECVCFPTNSTHCLLICEDDQNNIICCNSSEGNKNKEGNNSGNNCVCFNANGASCICICKDDKGSFKKCDDCRCSIENDTKTDLKCNKKGCVCIPSEGKSCVLVCEDEKGDIITCTKNDGKNCVCINTNGSSCICVCKDGKAGYKKCNDCCCSTEGVTKTEIKCEIERCECMPTEGKSTVLICEDEKGNIVACDKEFGKNCVCIETNGDSCICVCKDGKGGFKKCVHCSCAIKDETMDEMK